jgi:hypothetical protein
MIKSAVRKLILANASASTLLGSSRVYPSRLPPKYLLPSIVISLVSSRPNTMHSGNGGRLFETTLQLSVIASSESQGQALQDLLITALDLKNTTVTLGSKSVQILASFLDDLQDLDDAEFEKEEEIVKTLDFSFIWRNL